MNPLAQAFVVVAASIHVWVRVCESFLFHRPGVHRGIFKTPTEHVPALRLWTYCQGFYNLFLAAGLVAGLVALHSREDDVGRWLILYICAFMIGTGVLMGLYDRRHLGGAVGQAFPPLVVVAAVALG
jgi:putative membrane protein